MTIVDFITELFCCVDDKLSQHGKNHKHSQVSLAIHLKWLPLPCSLRSRVWVIEPPIAG